MSGNLSECLSSCVDANVVTYDANFDRVDINDEAILNNSDDAIIESEDDDDAGNFSIADSYSSEDDVTLADEQKDIKTLSAVRTRRTGRNNASSAEAFFLAREAVVRFVQDSIAHAVDRQKQNADKNERANVLSFIEGDFVLLSMVNLPRHIVINVCSSKILLKCIGPFRVLRRQGNAYTIELPRRIRAHPTFLVGLLRPYCQCEPSSSDGDSPPRSRTSIRLLLSRSGRSVWMRTEEISPHS